AEIGVVLLMFSAGLETNLKDLMKTGPIAFLIACAGVFVPLVGGTFLYMGLYGVAPWGSEEFYKAVFVGVIMTATSVSITVQALKELGKLKGKVGTTILSAAIIDDVIGIIVLTFVIGFKNPETDPMGVMISTLLFFLAAVGVGFILYLIFKKIDQRYPHTRRIPILGLALCFAFAYCAEKWFGIADITGAYVAGIILCSIQDSQYIDEKIDINSYMLFGPVFFASIGLKTSIDNIDAGIIIFSIGFVLVALVTKIIGCGLMAKLCKFSVKDSLKVGVGMMTRGEVALIVSQKGLSVGLLTPVYFTAVILLIIASSISTPIILKLLYSKDPKTAAE
ncbi:MAG: cation:proton antiporter, partial [Lachnospiraceae bacterium]|nr:cation:proton antiporter [Lachnospiraceae bacterium]